jgi:rhodanese-related sulfurtransferase
MGIENVVALKNGTMGWQLAGLELETKSSRTALPSPSPVTLERSEERARRVAIDAGVVFVDPEQAKSIMARADRENVYPIDVRTREEHLAGHIPGFRWAPGGQLVQATDNYIAVKSGSILLACDGVVRSCLTAAWLREMGFPNIQVLEGGTSAWLRAGGSLETGTPPPEPFGYGAARERVSIQSSADLTAILQSTVRPAILFIGTSDEFSSGHLPASKWLSRSWLEIQIDAVVPDRDSQVVVTCPDGVASVLAASTLVRMGYWSVSVLEDGTRAWAAAGFQLERGLTGVTRAPDDVLPPSRSYAEMLNYLRWEEELGRKYVPA